MQLSNSGVLMQVIQRNLMQGIDVSAPISHGLQSTNATVVAETGQPFRDDAGNLVAQCGIDLLEIAVCGL